VLACVAAVAIGATGVTDRVEGDAIDRSFTHRAPSVPDDVAVIAIDTRSLDVLPWRWPFPRTAHARLVDRLHAAGVRQIVFDVEFAQPTPGRQSDDLALWSALGHAGGGVLAATETDAQGHTQVLGGDENLRTIHAQAAAAAIDVDRGGVARRLPLQDGGLPTMAVTVARRLGVRVPRSAFTSQGAWIDFAGPPGTVPTYSYADVYRGRVPRSALAGRVVVVGATSPLLHDLHSAPTSDGVLMSGAELQANAVHTALAGFPLRSAGSWLAVLTAMLLAAGAALLVLTLRPLRAAAGALVIAVTYVVATQALFAQGWIAPVVVPLIALGLSVWWSLTAVLVIERAERRRVTAANAALEHAVRERTAELHRAHLEIVRRLAYAVESRDGETGAHVDRMSALCELLALAAGMGPQYAELLRHASVLHDIGKLSVPDAILLKRGQLDDDEREQMRTHALAGAAIRRARRAHASRALGRQRLPRRPARRGDPDRGPDRGDLRRLRRARVRAALQARLVGRRGDHRSGLRARPPLRPGTRRRVRRDGLRAARVVCAQRAAVPARDCRQRRLASRRNSSAQPTAMISARNGSPHPSTPAIARTAVTTVIAAAAPPTTTS